jgi:hypothetical protein
MPARVVFCGLLSWCVWVVLLWLWFVRGVVWLWFVLCVLVCGVSCVLVLWVMCGCGLIMLLMSVPDLRVVDLAECVPTRTTASPAPVPRIPPANNLRGTEGVPRSTR